MNTDIQQDGKPDIVFQEYSKDVVAYFNGYGSIVHTVNAVCKDTAKTTIEHRFGSDEGIVNPFFNPQFSLKKANQNFLTNKQGAGECDFGFGVFALKPHGFIGYEELPSLENEKRFRINWANVFGKTVKEATYSWIWDKKGMFPFPESRKDHKSLLKVVYPTNKLTFRLIVNALYPIEGNPYIAVIDAQGEESLFMQVYPVELKKENLSFNYSSIQPSKCFKIEINNPVLGCTYEMRWTSEIVKRAQIIH
jgi:hypothetical protein